MNFKMRIDPGIIEYIYTGRLNYNRDIMTVQKINS